MSVWKKASKTNQKTHRERHQPEERQRLGLLEKKKDYRRRAQDYNEKQQTLKVLRKKALNKNPDEFYHHMINAKIDNGGVHHDKNKAEEDTEDQLLLMRTQDLKYVTLKRNQEKKKIEKLQASLNLMSVDSKKKNQHIRFVENLVANESVQVPDFDLDALARASEQKKSLYKELAKRIGRERELTIVQQKLEMKRHVEGKKSVIPPKRIKRATRERPAIYQWQYERKK